MLAVVLLILLWRAAASTVGKAIAYEEAPALHRHMERAEPSTDKELGNGTSDVAFYSIGGTASEFKQSLRVNFRIVAVGVSVLLLTLIAIQCVCLSEGCVRKRINRNRRLPIGVVQHQQPTNDEE